MSQERALQQAYGSTTRANRFYKKQVIDYLNDPMIAFIAQMEMLFVSTANRQGHCDSSIRVGKPGFLQVIDSRRIAYPEYRGNGVYASLGNIAENPHIGLLMVDFYKTTIGLHINGTAAIVEHVDGLDDPLAERWVSVEVEEAYIQCSKHIPRLEPQNKPIRWNTDDEQFKGGDFFELRKKESATRQRPPSILTASTPLPAAPPPSTSALFKPEQLSQGAQGAV